MLIKIIFFGQDYFLCAVFLSFFSTMSSTIHVLLIQLNVSLFFGSRTSTFEMVLLAKFEMLRSEKKSKKQITKQSFIRILMKTLVNHFQLKNTLWITLYRYKCLLISRIRNNYLISSSSFRLKKCFSHLFFTYVESSFYLLWLVITDFIVLAFDHTKKIHAPNSCLN